MSTLDLYEDLIRACEVREAHVIPDTMRRRLADMWSRSVEKAMVVGWHKVELLEADAGTPSVIRAAERALHDTE